MNEEILTNLTMIQIRQRNGLTLEDVAIMTGYDVNDVIDFEQSREYIQVFSELLDFYMDLWCKEFCKDYHYDYDYDAINETFNETTKYDEEWD